MRCNKFCLEYQERAKSKIPGMVQLLSKRPDMFSLGVWPTYFKKADGVHVWDLDGNQYIDMSVAGVGANVLGYCDPDVDEAVSKIIQSGNSSSLNAPEDVELAELLCELHPWAEKVRYARTGGEAMAMAVRIARAATGKDKVVFCGYHGWHDWYLAANLGTENALGEHLLSGLEPVGVPEVLKGTALTFRYNHPEDLKEILSMYNGEIGAVVLEAIRSEPPTEDFIATVHSTASELRAALIVDEISSGFRMNTGGAHLKLGIKPDIAVFSKALGNGYPMAAVIGKNSVMEAAQNSFISSTYWTERIGPAAALAMIKKHKDQDVSEKLMETGKKIQQGWRSIAQRHNLPIQVKGIPPLSHFSFEHQEANILKALFIQMMLEKGMLAGSSFYAMWSHQQEHVEAYLQSFDRVFAQLSNWLQDGKLHEHLQGEPSASGFKRLT